MKFFTLHFDLQRNLKETQQKITLGQDKVTNETLKHMTQKMNIKFLNTLIQPKKYRKNL